MVDILKAEEIEKKTTALIELFSRPLTNLNCYDDPLPPLEELDLSVKHDEHTLLSILIIWNLEKATELIDLMHRQYLDDAVILTALNKKHPFVEKRIKDITNTFKKRTAEEIRFCSSLMSALSQDAFITEVEGKKIPSYRRDLEPQLPDAPIHPIAQKVETKNNADSETRSSYAPKMTSFLAIQNVTPPTPNSPRTESIFKGRPPHNEKLLRWGFIQELKKRMKE